MLFLREFILLLLNKYSRNNVISQQLKYIFFGVLSWVISSGGEERFVAFRKELDMEPPISSGLTHSLS